MPVDFTGDWNKAEKILNNMEKKYDRAKKRALKKVGQYLIGKIRRGIRDQKPGGQEYEPLHPFTVERKGSSKAMIDDGDFIGSITMKLENDTLFVGVLRQARGSDGEELVNIAEVHEYGVEIAVTNKMRNYLHSVGLHLKATTNVIKIPARPTFGPILEKEKDEIAKIIEKEIQAVLFGN